VMRLPSPPSSRFWRPRHSKPPPRPSPVFGFSTN
jgi:hypothetical protein